MHRNIYVIAEPCIGVKDLSCVDVCPVDCIHGGENEPQLYIDPNECIGCGFCEPVCPVDAIYPEDDLPDVWRGFAEANAAFYRRRG
jgi:ferredoxin